MPGHHIMILFESCSHDILEIKFGKIMELNSLQLHSPEFGIAILPQ